MRILVDIGHPAHVHFFFHPIRILRNQGHDIIVTSRRKEIATDLLDGLDIPHEILSSHPGGGGLGALAKEMMERDAALWRTAGKFKPDVMTGIGGVNPAHVRIVTGIPAIVFYDTENAVLSNLITYPFASLVAVPSCYQAWLPPWHLRYPGYHELSYLHPKRFVPDRDRAIMAGLDPVRPTFLIRTVSWKASHDVNEQGWSEDLLVNIVYHLSSMGKVLISSEGALSSGLEQYRFKGPVTDIHHLMAFARLFVGESATMASECAVLGTPAVYAALTGRGYTDQEESGYGLVKNVKDLTWAALKDAIDCFLSRPADVFHNRRDRLLADKIDVAEFVADLVSGYPGSVPRLKHFFKGMTGPI